MKMNKQLTISLRRTIAVFLTLSFIVPANLYATAPTKTADGESVNSIIGAILQASGHPFAGTDSPDLAPFGARRGGQVGVSRAEARLGDQDEPFMAFWSPNVQAVQLLEAAAEIAAQAASPAIVSGEYAGKNDPVNFPAAQLLIQKAAEVLNLPEAQLPKSDEDWLRFLDGNAAAFQFVQQARSELRKAVVRTVFEAPEGQPKNFFTNSIAIYNIGNILGKASLEQMDAITQAIKADLDEHIKQKHIKSHYVTSAAGTVVTVHVTHQFGERNAAVHQLMLLAMFQGLKKAGELNILSPNVDLKAMSLENIGRTLQVKANDHSISERGAESVVVAQGINVSMGAANIKLFHEFAILGATPLQKLGLSGAPGFRFRVRRTQDILKGNYDGPEWEFEISANRALVSSWFTRLVDRIFAFLKFITFQSAWADSWHLRTREILQLLASRLGRNEGNELLALASQPNDYQITAVYPVEGGSIPADQPLATVVYQPVFSQEGESSLNPTIIYRSQSGADAVGAIANMVYEPNVVPGGPKGENFVVTSPATHEEAKLAPPEGVGYFTTYVYQSRENGVIPPENGGVGDHAALNPPSYQLEKDLARELAAVIIKHPHDQPYIAPWASEKNAHPVRQEQDHLFVTAPKDTDPDPYMRNVQERIRSGKLKRVSDIKADMGGKPAGHTGTPEMFIAIERATLLEAVEQGKFDDANTIGAITERDADGNLIPKRVQDGERQIGDDGHLLILGDRSENGIEGNLLAFIAFTRAYLFGSLLGKKYYGLGQDFAGPEAKGAKANPFYYSHLTERFFEILEQVMPESELKLGSIQKVRTEWEKWQRGERKEAQLADPFSGNVSSQGAGEANYAYDPDEEDTVDVVAGDKLGPAGQNRVIREAVFKAVEEKAFKHGLVVEIWDEKAFDEHGNIAFKDFPPSVADIKFLEIKNQEDHDFVFGKAYAGGVLNTELTTDEKVKLAGVLKKSGFVPTKRIFLDAEKDRDAIIRYAADSDRFNFKRVWKKSRSGWNINNAFEYLDRPILGAAVTRLGILSGGEYLGKDDPVMLGHTKLFKYVHEFLRTEPVIVQGDMNGSHWEWMVPTGLGFAVATQRSHPIIVGLRYKISKDGKRFETVEDIYGKPEYDSIRYEAHKFNRNLVIATLGQFEFHGTNWRTVEAAYALAKMLRELNRADSPFLVANKKRMHRNRAWPIPMANELREVYNVALSPDLSQAARSEAREIVEEYDQVTSWEKAFDKARELFNAKEIDAVAAVSRREFESGVYAASVIRDRGVALGLTDEEYLDRLARISEEVYTGNTTFRLFKAAVKVGGLPAGHEGVPTLVIVYLKAGEELSQRAEARAPAVRVAINGAGRIGVNFIRAWLQREKSEIEVVALNDLAFKLEQVDSKDEAIVAKNLKNLQVFIDNLVREFDTKPRSKLVGKVIFNSDRDDLGYWIGLQTSLADVHKIYVTSIADPAALPWKALNVDVALESTGRFTDPVQAGKHLTAGARKVIISAPGKGDLKTIVAGVNQEIIDEKTDICSGASCTTGAIAPVLKVFQDKIGIEAFYTPTTHARTSDQAHVDTLRPEAPARGIASPENIVVTSTGAAKAIGEVIPALKGKGDGMALRVPTADGSIVAIVIEASRRTSKDEVNSILKAAASELPFGVLGFEEKGIDASVDILGRTESSIVSGRDTSVSANGSLVVIYAWYDNEFGYANRAVDLAGLIGKRSEAREVADEEILSAITESISRITEFTPSELSKLSLEDDLQVKYGLDSIDLADLSADLEEKFDIRLSADDAGDWRTVRNVVEAVQTAAPVNRSEVRKTVDWSQISVAPVRVYFDDDYHVDVYDVRPDEGVKIAISHVHVDKYAVAPTFVTMRDREISAPGIVVSLISVKGNKASLNISRSEARTMSEKVQGIDKGIEAFKKIVAAKLRGAKGKPVIVSIFGLFDKGPEQFIAKIKADTPKAWGPVQFITASEYTAKAFSFQGEIHYTFQRDGRINPLNTFIPLESYRNAPELYVDRTRFGPEFRKALDLGTKVVILYGETSEVLLREASIVPAVRVQFSSGANVSEFRKFAFDENPADLLISSQIGKTRDANRSEAREVTDGEILQAIAEIISDLQERPVSQVSPKDDLRAEYGLDSMDFAELSFRIEEEFDISLAVDVVNDWEKAGDVVRSVKEALAKKAGRGRFINQGVAAIFQYRAQALLQPLEEKQFNAAPNFPNVVSGVRFALDQVEEKLRSADEDAIDAARVHLNNVDRLLSLKKSDKEAAEATGLGVEEILATRAELAAITSALLVYSRVHSPLGELDTEVSNVLELIGKIDQIKIDLQGINAKSPNRAEIETQANLLEQQLGPLIYTEVRLPEAQQVLAQARAFVQANRSESRLAGEEMQTIEFPPLPAGLKQQIQETLAAITGIYRSEARLANQVFAVQGLNITKGTLVDPAMLFQEGYLVYALALSEWAKGPVAVVLDPNKVQDYRAAVRTLNEINDYLVSEGKNPFLVTGSLSRAIDIMEKQFQVKEFQAVVKTESAFSTQIVLLRRQIEIITERMLMKLMSLDSRLARFVQIIQQTYYAVSRSA